MAASSCCCRASLYGIEHFLKLVQGLQDARRGSAQDLPPQLDVPGGDPCRIQPAGGDQRQVGLGGVAAARAAATRCGR